MSVEFTGRQFEVTPALRKQVEGGLDKLARILGKSFDTHIVLTIEKKRCKAEITVKVRDQALVGIAEAMEMAQAIGEAMEKIDRQAVRWKTRYRSKKRIARRKAAGDEWKGASAHEPATQQQTQEARIVVGPDEARAVNVVVHAFPGANIVRDAYVVPSSEAVAFRAMSLEEAVKEAEFRNREVFVFRDKSGKVIILHRKKDGKIELIEAP
jgi:putative sigma-54 modulation protein